ncbi:MAG: TonB-dependent receptor domain-containing protein [Bryobacteraceae bacterium]
MSVLLFAARLVAQEAAFSGRVTDPEGRAVVGAQLSAVHLATGWTLEQRTDSAGYYSFAGMRVGVYRVQAQATGFQLAEKTLTLTVGDRLIVDFPLSLAEQRTSVEVRDTALNVNRENTAVSTLFTRELIQDLPLNGRSFQSLLELTPGVVLAPARIDSPGQFAVNGQRANANYFMVDGVSANVAASASATFTQQAAGTLPALTILGTSSGLVSIDALQEFRISTSSHSAEYGRMPGGQVMLVTRSGTNRYSGSAYNYFRNERLDANDWFANRNGIARQPLRQNNFGGVLGGPVLIPNLYSGRDRTFFFFSYEGLKLRQPQATLRNVLVPSQEARQKAQGAARAVLEAFPLPNAPLLPGDRQDANLGRYVSGTSNPGQFVGVSLRLDHRFTSRFYSFLRWNTAPSETSSRVFANQNNRNEIDLTTVTAGLTWAVSAELASDLRVNWSGSQGRFEFAGEEIDGAKLPPDSLLFGPNLPKETSSVTLNLLTSPNTLSLSQGRVLGNDQRQWNIVETLSYYRAGHNLKFGLDYRRLAPAVKARSLGVTHAFTTRAGSNGVTDLLETSRVNVSIQALAPVTDFRIHNFSAFAQDTWRVAPRLTLNYGIRYELNPAPTGRLLPYRLDQVRDPLQAQLAPPNARLYDTQWLNFAPRGGIAWQLDGRGDLVLRAGWGVYYDLGNGPALQGYTSYPYNSIRNLPGEVWPVPVEKIQPAPFNQNPPYSATFRVMDPQLRLPYSVQWNVTLERSFGPNHVASIAYVGSRGERLLRTELLRNMSAFGQPIIPVINPALFAPTSTVYITRNEASQRYHSLQAQFQRRMAGGLDLLASYTWSKAIDNISDEATGGLPITGIGFFNLDLEREFAPADYDVRHTFTSGFTWKLPAAGTGPVRALTGGWSLQGIVRARSGFPFHVITQVVDPLNFGSNRRVDYLGGPNWLEDPGSPGGRRLNPAAFRIPPESGRLGTLGRNSLRGFGMHQVDLAVRRQLKVTESLALQFRAEAFNILNTPNFGLPNASLNPIVDPFFGQPTRMLGRSLGAGGTAGGLSPLYQVGGPRSLQLSLRIQL